MLNQVLSPVSSGVHVIENNGASDKTILVGAYCRVSTNLDVQKASLDTQILAYEKIINEHPGWVLAGIYADKGLSGTSVNRRTEFQRMIADAKEGKLNYILVKSISRFSRNTVDLLQYVRDLKKIGVYVYFEKERIDTGKTDSEFMVSIFGAAAQEEIISLSNNMKVGRRMRFAQGKQQWTHIYGYRRGWEIVPAEAEVIRKIYDMYLSGCSLPFICKSLTEAGIAVPTGKGKWAAHTLSEIIKNEKYKGACLMQKSYIKDPIRHEKVSNRNALVPQYFKQDHHTPIIPKEVWDAANLVLTMKDRKRGSTQYPLYGILRCPVCGANMVRFHYCKGEYFWTCSGQNSGGTRQERSKCPLYAIHESDLLRSLKGAGLPLEYWPLRQQVESITFPKYDWDHLIIHPAETGAPYRIPITYDLPSNSPLPIITEAPHEWPLTRETKTVLTTFINGKPVNPSVAPRMLERICGIQNHVRNLTILPPEKYEADVLRVESGKKNE